MGRIIAIGGGDRPSGDTFPLNRHIVDAVEKDRPQVLYLPTASNDAEEKIDEFTATYEEDLGCDVEVLELVDKDYTENELEALFERADIVYAEGGDTRRMLEIWESEGLNGLLRKAYENGTVMSGRSAGAICWFEYGHSDSESFSDQEKWSYIQLPALGFIDGVILCPHYHTEEREESFKYMIEQNPGKVGLAVNDNTAIDVEDGSFSVVKSTGDGRAYIIRSVDGEIIEEELSTGKNYPLEKLY